MPSSIALVLCCAFILLMLKSDKKQAAGMSLALWIPTLWMLYCGSRPLACWKSNDLLLSASSSGVSEGSAIDRNFLLSLLLLGLATLARRRFNWKATLKNNYWLTALFVFVLVSAVWSDAPFVSIKRVIKLVGSLVMAMVILSESSPGQALEVVLRRVAYILIPSSLLLIKYFSNLGVFYLPRSGNRWWIGVTTTKNNLGVLCTVTAVFLFWSLLMNWKQRKAPEIRWRCYFDLLVLVTSLYILKGEVAYSATSMACLAIGVSTIFGLRWIQTHQKSLRVPMLMTPVMLVFFFGACVPFLGTAAFSGLTSLLGRDVTFTGRTTIWAQLAPMALQDPFLGHGYGGFWLGTSYAEVNEAHNGYLEIALGLGFAGLFFVMAFIASCCREAYIGINQGAKLALLGFALVIMLALHNVTEASLLVETDLMWTSLIFAKMVNRAEMGVMAKGPESTVELDSEPATSCPDEVEAPRTARSRFVASWA